MNPHPPTVIERAVRSAAQPHRVRAGPAAAELALVVVFLSLVASGLLIQTAVELRRGEGVSALEVFRQKPTSANLRAYEHSLEDASVLARALRPWFQFAQFAWLRDGGEKALVGRDGWLFYRPGFDDMVARRSPAATATNDPVAAIVAFRDALAARGIQLLVVPAPNKESVYPDQLTRRSLPGPNLDVAQHARPAGAAPIRQRRMRGLVRRVRRSAQPTLPQRNRRRSISSKTATGRPPAWSSRPGPWRSACWNRAGPGPGHTVYSREARAGGASRRRAAHVAVDRHRTGSVPETVPCVQVVRADSGQPYQDEPDSEVLVLGDSFLRIYSRTSPARRVSSPTWRGN